MIMGVVKQIITITCGFVLPVYILKSYGSAVNGLVSSITQFLAFISFLEMGVGPVIQSNLYKPLVNRNWKDISLICKSSERFFRKIAYIFMGYIVFLIIIFPRLINTNYGFIYTGTLIVIIAISSFAQYFFGITYQLLLNADQKAYIQLSLQAGTILFNTILSVVMMRMGASIHSVKLVTSLVYVLRPLCMMFYVHKKYKIDKTIKVVGEPIKQKWNGFAQHLASVVVSNTDVVVLTIFSSLENVSIYSVYYTVVRGITDVIMTAVTGLEAMWGNMIAKKEIDQLQKSFGIIEWAIHFVISFLFSATAVLIVPFINVYTRGITDVNYNVPVFAFLLVLSYAFLCLRVPYFRIIKAAGHYKETQNGSFIQMFINIILSVILVIKWGLVGVTIGTLIAMAYHTIYFAYYLREHILYRKISIFFKHLFVDVIIVVCVILFTKFIKLSSITYIAWIIMAIKVSVISFAITFIMNVIVYKKSVQHMVRLIKNYFVKYIS